MIVRVASWFKNADPHVLAGVAGLGLATSSWVLAAYALVQLLSDPAYLVALYWAIMRFKGHAGPPQSADYYTIAQLVGALVALFGTAIISLALTLWGKGPSLRALLRKTVPANVGASSTSDTEKGPS